MSKFLFIIIFLYSKKSFDDTKSWLEDLRKNSLPDLKIFLIGNKSDLEESRLVTKEQGIKFKEENNLYFFTEASAKSEKDAQEIFIEAAKVLYQDYLENKKSATITEKKISSEIKSNTDEKLQIVAFSTNDREGTPNDLINMFLEQQNHKILKKSKYGIAFSTILKNSSEETRIMICSVLNITKEYTGIKDVNCYLLFIDLEKKDSIEQFNSIIEYAKDNCNLKKKFFVFGMISGSEEKEILINKSDIIEKLDEEKIKYIYKEINKSEIKEICDTFMEIFDFSKNHPINDIYESDEEKKDKKSVENENHSINDKIESDEEKKDKKSVENEINPYDIILRFKSIESIKQGWDILLSETGLKYFNSFIKCPKIGVLGNKFAGKSFVLSALFGFPKSEYSFYTNNQITIKIKERKNKINYILFDSIGLDKVILNEKNSDDEIDSSNEGEEFNIKKENDNNNIMINNDIKEKKEKLNDFIDIKNFEELEMNKKLTEKFITTFMVDYIDILIVVIGILKYPEQLLLKNIMEECLKYKKGTLYVMHNIGYMEEKNRKKYIKNILMKNGLFDLEEKKEIKIQQSSDSEDEEENSEGEDDIPTYYISKYKSSLTVYHFILNYIYKEESNNKNNEFIKEKMQSFLNVVQPNKFNLYESFKKKIYELLKNYSKNKEEMKIELKEIEDNKRKIILKSNDDLQFSNDLINLKNEIQFKYNYYISDDNKKLVILIERSGIITDVQISGSKEDNKYIILYKGKKCLSEEEKKCMKKMKNVGRQFGEFIMEIPIILNEYEINNLEEPNHYDKNGIEYIEYNITKISGKNLEKNN